MTRRIAKKIVRRSPARPSGTYKKPSIWKACHVAWRNSGARHVTIQSAGCGGPISIKIVVHYKVTDVWVATPLQPPAEPYRCVSGTGLITG